MKFFENLPFCSGPRFSKHNRAGNEEDDKNKTFHFFLLLQRKKYIKEVSLVVEAKNLHQIR